MPKKPFALPALAFALVVLACSYHLYTPLPDGIAEPAKLQVFMVFLKIMRASTNLIALISPYSHIETMDIIMEMAMARHFYSAAAGDVKLTETELAGVPVVIYRHVEADATSAPATVFFHGGGFVLLSAKAYDFTTYDIARGTKAVVVSVDYRRGLSHPFPAAVHDCINVTTHLLREGQRYGIDVNRIGVAGDSAGGNLATVVALHLGENRKTGGRRKPGEDLPALKFQALFYPLLQAVDFWLPSYMDNNDVTPAILNRNFITYLLAVYFGLGQNAKHYGSVMANGDHLPSRVTKEYSKYVDRSQLYEQNKEGISFKRPSEIKDIIDPYSVDKERSSVDLEVHKLLHHKVTDPMFSPLFAADVSQAPPTFLHVAEFDVLRDEGLLYARKLRDAGVKVITHYSKGGVHGEITKLGTRHFEFRLGDIALEKMYEFVKETLSR
ncbi:arylacetamide deacetylase [Elysia marginata]|uniref:Arylacetamide deacetylase n=1 Tax=Elysia marginata TaxID=1093978 RepID=A0AAV4IVC8_9GAST|nr:arylacetamide deacetylase [Elysia marginata]